MKPLATPVLGGMLSSMALVLIVTPVLFYWLREREIRQAERRGAVERPELEPRSAGGPAA
jgi:copper/silver efflux system protein